MKKEGKQKRKYTKFPIVSSSKSGSEFFEIAEGVKWDAAVRP